MKPINNRTWTFNAEGFFHPFVFCLFSTSVVRLREEKGEEKKKQYYFNI